VCINSMHDVDAFCQGLKSEIHLTNDEPMRHKNRRFNSVVFLVKRERSYVYLVEGAAHTCTVLSQLPEAM